MLICPLNDNNWKDFVKKQGGGVKGERAAYQAWIENGYEIPNIKNYDLGNLSIVIEELRKKSNLSVLIDTDFDSMAKIETRDNEKVLVINPTKFENDAVINEFGHVFIELLGGIKNPINNLGAKPLEESNIMKAIREQSPDLSEEEISQAALSVALSADLSKVFNNKPDMTKFESWSRGFFNRLKTNLGISKEDAMSLMSTPINSYKSSQIDAAKIENSLYNVKEEDAYASLTNKEKQVKKAMQIIETKINQLERTLDTSSKSQKGALIKLKNLYKQFERSEAEAALYGFARSAGSQIDTVEKKFTEYLQEKGNPNLDSIKYLKDAMLSFDTELLKEIRNDLSTEQEDIKQIINTAIVKQVNIHDMYKKLAAKFLVEEIDVPVEVIQSRYERKAEMEFGRVFRDIKDSKERAEKKEQYIAEFLEKNKDAIEADKKKYVENFLTVINRDLSMFDALVGNPKDLNNDIVQTVAQLFEKMDYDTRMESLFMVKNAEDAYEKYINFFGKKKEQKDQWNPILAEVEGKIIPALASPGSKKWVEIKQGKYKGTPVEEMYDVLMALAKERDENIPASFRLKNKLPIMHKNFYERVGENGIFKAIKEGTVDQFKIRKDETEFGELDENSSAARYSLDKSLKVGVTAGQERRVIPIHYRNSTIKEEDRSFDVLTLMVLDSYQSIEFKNKRNISNKVEGILDLVKEAKVYERSGILGRLKTDKHGNPVIKKEGSNVAKAIENIIENRLYGIKTSGDPKSAKVINKVRQYSSFVNLFMNYISGGANLTQGMAMVFMEGTGSKFYGIKNVQNAAAKYRKDLPYIIKDNTNRVYKSKTNLLREMFDANSEYVALQNEFSKDSALKREGNLGVGFAFNSAAEHTAQSIGMYSVFDNIKVKDKDGNYFNSKGEIVTDRNKAMSLDEAYSVGYQNKNSKKTISAEEFASLEESQKGDYIANVLHLDNKVASTDRSEEGVNTFAISQTLKRINRDLFGNYDKDNRSIIERNAVGGLFTHMRGWLEPGVKKRFKGTSTIFISDKESWKKFRTLKNIELRNEDLYYNQETKQFEEGMYVTWLRFASNVLGEIRALKFKVLSENWKDLTDMERKNIVKATVEGIVLPTLAFIVFSALSASLEDDDEDRFMTELSALYARRLMSELMTYYDPGEWLRTFRSPAVTLSLLESTKDAIVQITSAPLEEYDRGPNKGDNKAAVKLMKITPGKALFRDPAETLKFYTR